MNDRDRDLIIALIEGSLSEQDAGAASARIASDPELAAEYEIQRSIHEALSDVEPVAMTVAERSTLRSNLVEQLHLEEAAPAVAAPPSARRSAWWLRPALAIGSVAAVFVIGVAVVPGMLPGGSDDSSDEIAAAVATTTVASADTGGADGAGESTEGGAPTNRLLEVPAFDSPDLDELLDSVSGTYSTDDIAEEAEDYAQTQATIVVSQDDVDACRAQLGRALPDGELQVIGAEREDSGTIVVTVAFTDTRGAKVLATIDLSTCVLVDVAE